MIRIAPFQFPVLWLTWALYWRIQSRGAKANVWRESVPSRLMHVVPMGMAALLLALPAVPVLGLNQRFLPRSLAIFWAGWLLAAAGLLFTVWARRHLAGNWSADVTLKADHDLITSGSRAAPTRWYVIRSTRAYCWASPAMHWRSANGAASLRLPWRSWQCGG